MKKVLNLVLSYDVHPYNEMVRTQEETWDSVKVDGVETIFYFGESGKQNTHNKIYMPVKESLHTMGHKLLLAFEWALANKEFDYIGRPHSCIYVNKKALIDYVQDLPSENVFSVLKVEAEPKWAWGGIGFILSRDVVQRVVDNKSKWRHDLMEDVALSYCVNDLGIPYTNGKGASIDDIGGGVWRCMLYNGGDSFEFTDFADIKKSEGQYYYRVKQDGRRDLDKFIMERLFEHLK